MNAGFRPAGYAPDLARMDQILAWCVGLHEGWLAATFQPRSDGRLTPGTGYLATQPQRIARLVWLASATAYMSEGPNLRSNQVSLGDAARRPYGPGADARLSLPAAR